MFAFFVVHLSSGNTAALTVPVLPTIQPLTYCDPNNDGFGAFDLTTVTPIILAAQSGASSDYQISFHETMADAASGSSPITGTYNNINPFTQTVYYLIVQISSGDAAIGNFELVVNPSPQATTPNNISLCDDNNDGSQVFDLTMVIPQALTTLDPSTTNVTFYTSLADAESFVSPIFNSSSYVSTGQTIFARVTTNTTSCYDVVSFQLIVVQRPFANGPQNFADCDNYGNPFDGIHMLDLTQFASAILNGQNPAVFLVSYYTSLADAQTGSNALSQSQAQAYYTNPDIDTIWVKVENTNSGIEPFCYAVTTINIRVERRPNPVITSTDNRSSICVEYPTELVLGPLTLNSNIVNPAAYTFEWYEIADPNTVIGTVSTYTVNTSLINGGTRSYSVKVRSNSVLGCSIYSSPFDVIQSGPAAITQSVPNGYTITNLSGVQSITVSISGYGMYEYSLDNGPHQNSNVFDNVSLGLHTIHVWDLEGGCGELSIDQVLIAESQVPAPTGLNSQTLPSGSTLANLIVDGQNIQWYASASNKMTLTTNAVPLPLNTVLIDGITYYATQTVGGIESVARLPVTVHLTLGIDENEVFPIQFAPNPVENNLALQSTQVLKSVTVYTILGQKVFEQNYDANYINIDLSHLTTGNYILKAQGENGQKTIRIIKE